jgi:hypothetical protein
LQRADARSAANVKSASGVGTVCIAQQSAL